MARKIDEFTLEKFWTDYSTRLYAGMNISDVQYRETKRTFYAAFITSINALSHIMTSDVTDDEGSDKLHALMLEAEQFAQNQKFDERKESVGEVNLKELMVTFQEFLAPYDVGAHVIFLGRGSAEFKMLLPSWSVASFVQLDGGHEGIRIRAKKEQHRDIEDTTRLIVTTRDVCSVTADGMQNVLTALKETLTVDEKPTVHSSLTPIH